MKTKLILFGKLLMFFFGSQVGYSQQSSIPTNHSIERVPVEDNICYQVDIVERIKVVKGAQTSTLTEHDKVKFISRQSTKVHNSYFSETTSPVFDVYYKKYNDGFNNWYQMPDLVRTDENSTNLYYSKDSDLYPGGWFGNIATSQYGTFVRDRIPGERYYKQPHLNGTNGIYERITKYYKKFGFLAKLAFTIPEPLELQSFEQEGFEVITNVNYLTIRNEHKSITWQFIDKTIIEETFKSGLLTKTKKDTYTYNETYRTFLKQKSTMIVPQMFENGDCYDELMEEVYTNYGTACNDSDFALRSKKEPIGLGIKVSPIPARDNIEIDLGSRDVEISNLEVVNAQGSILYQGQDMSTRFINLDISTWPSGVYVVRVISDTTMESIKFVKQ